MSRVFGVLQGRFGRVTLFEADQPVHEHAHPHIHALFKIAGADGAYDVARTPCPVSDARVVLVNPWVPHANWRPAGGAPVTILALYLEAGWVAATAGGALGFAPFAHPSAEATPGLRRLAQTLAAALLRPEDDPSRLEVALQRVCARLLEDHVGLTLPTAARPLDHRVRKAMALMRAEPSKPHRLKELARAVGLSRSRFFEQFREGMGMAPGIYADTLRLEHAITRLLHSDSSAANVALELGFAAPSHFTRFFRAKTGLTPGAYRRAGWEVQPNSPSR